MAQGQLYRKLFGSNWCRNQSRSCAKESGGKSSRLAGLMTAAWVAESPFFAQAIRRASPASVGASNTVRSGNSMLKLSRTREINRVASMTNSAGIIYSGSLPFRNSRSELPESAASPLAEFFGESPLAALAAKPLPFFSCPLRLEAPLRRA